MITMKNHVQQQTLALGNSVNMPINPSTTKCTSVRGNFATLARQLPPASVTAICSFD